jgi:HAD superfamily hydrolase (TIGR01549 family)
MTTNDPLYQELLLSQREPADHALATRYAPIICFDSAEPFLPLAAGYTIFRADGPSPSFPRLVRLALESAPADLAIEYAIWWDWDIGHLYELEHVWVYLDATGQVTHAEASWHGGFHSMQQDGRLACEGDRVVILSEPGKHAFAPTSEWYAERRARRRSDQRELAGMGGVLVTNLFQGLILSCTPRNNTLVRTYLSQHAFTPQWDFGQRFGFTPQQLVPWSELQAWIPPRVAWWVEQLHQTIPPAAYRFLRVGHRGASAHAPDNTLAGIHRAAELGADMVEIDVQLTGDGVVVVCHDAAVRDRAGHWWPVQSSNLAELQAIDLGHGEHMPTLEEVIACCRDERLGLYIELKDGRAIPKTLALVQTRGSVGSTIIGAFRPDWLAEVKTLAPRMATSVLFNSPQVDAVQLAQAVGASYVHPCWERRTARPDSWLTDAWMARVRTANLGVVCWHEERPQVIEGLHRAGVDAICSDQPELLAAPPAIVTRSPHHILAICFDFGDTLADEASEVKDEHATTQRAELIPGAGEVVRELYERGYRLALVADGRPGAYVNVLTQHGLYGYFDAFAISEHVGVEKPHPQLFIHALALLGITPGEYSRTIMVGNYLARDIKGANALGMISIWLDWAPRRPKTPADASEIPSYTIKTPLELLTLLDQLERAASNRLGT